MQTVCLHKSQGGYNKKLLFRCRTFNEALKLVIHGSNLSAVQYKGDRYELNRALIISDILRWQFDTCIIKSIEVILSDPPIKERFTQFTTVPL